jgi:hypothetical protein
MYISLKVQITNRVWMFPGQSSDTMVPKEATGSEIPHQGPAPSGRTPVWRRACYELLLAWVQDRHIRGLSLDCQTFGDDLPVADGVDLDRSGLVLEPLEEVEAEILGGGSVHEFELLDGLFVQARARGEMPPTTLAAIGIDGYDISLGRIKGAAIRHGTDRDT